MSELERTEQATPRKRQKERQKGNVAKSQDVVAAVGLLVATVALTASAKTSAATAFETLRSAFADGFALQTDELSFVSEGSRLILFVLQKLAGFFLLVVFAGIIGNVLQTGFLILPKKALPDFKRVSPSANLKRVISGSAVAQTFGGIIRTSLFALLVAAAIRRDAQTLVALPYATPIEIILFFSKFAPNARQASRGKERAHEQRKRDFRNRARFSHFAVPAKTGSTIKERRLDRKEKSAKIERGSSTPRRQSAFPTSSTRLRTTPSLRRVSITRPLFVSDAFLSILPVDRSFVIE